ncbi:MAG: SDR family NAD(P)-dependent oxidoreductase [Lachnospiraceae bacterium]
MTPRTVLVTGASRGIGRAIALKFAQENYTVILNSKTNLTLLKDLKNQLTKVFSISCEYFLGDISDFTFVEKMFREINNRFGGVDILINNAGVSHIGLLSELPITTWDEIIAVNLTSAFYTSKLAIPNMVHQKSGKILNISSVWGNVGASCEVAYSASKGGINAFTKALAKELAPSNIQVNAISCGVIDTDMNQCFSEEERQALEEEIPSGRFGLPEEVADLALAISSGQSYLTGQIITLDGGWM